MKNILFIVLLVFPIFASSWEKQFPKNAKIREISIKNDSTKIFIGVVQDSIAPMESRKFYYTYIFKRSSNRIIFAKINVDTIIPAHYDPEVEPGMDTTEN